MSPADEALARRAVAAPGWRWLPGMIDQRGWRVLSRRTLRDEECVIAAHEDDDVHQWWRNSTGWHCSPTADEPQPEVALTDYPPPPLWLPDLADPATRGAFEEVVRLAWAPVLGSDCIISVEAAFSSIGADGVMFPAYTVRIWGETYGDVRAFHDFRDRCEALVVALEAAPRSTP